MLVVGIVLLILALLLGVGARRLQRRTGLPVAPIRYDDASARAVERALVSHTHRLTGKPDYLIEERGQLIPVEVKPTRRAATPYERDLVQLAGYCLLVEEQFGQRPPYGILRYAGQSWRVPYDDARRDHLLALLDEMDAAERAGDAARSHDQPARCAACSQRERCDQRLA